MALDQIKIIKSFYKRFTFLDFFLYGALWLLFVCFFFGYAPIDIVRALSTYDDAPNVDHGTSVLNCSPDKIGTASFDGGEKCVSWKSNFGLDALVFLDDENNIVRPKLTENFSVGREVFLERKFSSDNQISLDIVPQDEKKVNVSVNYGFLWRVIVGDGDYNKVTLQYNSKFPKENLSTDDWVTVSESNGNGWIFPNRGLEPRKKISIVVRSQAVEGSSKISVDVVVNGFLMGEDVSKGYNFHYSVPTIQKADELSTQVGFGLLDPHQENISTRLLRFEVIAL